MKYFILFGSTGDLATRYVLPALGSLLDRGVYDRLICVGRREWGVEDFGAFLAPFSGLINHLGQVSYVKIDIDKGDFAPLYELMERICTSNSSPLEICEITHHLCLSPEYFVTVARGLAAVGLNGTQTRVMIEKPFGYDLKSAIALNLELQEYFREEQIYRVDHFLGKNFVRELYDFRFSKGVLWPENRVASIKICANETIEVSDRVAFYEKVGETRDKLQNHLLQVLAICIMKLPIICNQKIQSAASDDEEVRDRIFQAISSITPLLIDPRHDIILGQYRGYRDLPGVAPNSQTTTYVRTHLVIDDPRWRGVEVILETGKALSKKESSVTIVFHDGTTKVFEETSQNKNNAYELLIEKALERDASYFVRWDSIRAAWQVVNDLIHCTDNCPILRIYEKGSEAGDI